MMLKMPKDSFFYTRYSVLRPLPVPFSFSLLPCLLNTICSTTKIVASAAGVHCIIVTMRLEKNATNFFCKF